MRGGEGVSLEGEGRGGVTFGGDLGVLVDVDMDDWLEGQ